MNNDVFPSQQPDANDQGNEISRNEVGIDINDVDQTTLSPTREDTFSSNIEPETGPITPTTVITKKRSNIGKILGVLGLVLLLAAAVGVAYWQYSEAQKVKAEQANMQTQLTSAQKQVADLQSQVKKPTETSTQTTTPTTTKTDDDLIIDTTKAWVYGSTKDSKHDETITIRTKELPFARTSVQLKEGGGYACWLKKSNEVWVVMFCGQAPPEQATLDLWGVPASMVQ